MHFSLSSVLKPAMVFSLVLATMTGCVSIPEAPSVAVMPPQGKPFDLFNQEEKECREHASKQIDTDSAKFERTAAVVGSGVVGTLIGAAFGGIIGGHDAARTGAIAGGVTGGLDGLGQSGGYRTELQNRYNISYQQCMVAKGNIAPPATYPVRTIPSLGGGHLIISPGFIWH